MFRTFCAFTAGVAEGGEGRRGGRLPRKERGPVGAASSIDFQFWHNQRTASDCIDSPWSPKLLFFVSSILGEDFNETRCGLIEGWVDSDVDLDCSVVTKMTALETGQGLAGN